MTAIDFYTCPEPGREFILGATGPMGTDDYNDFAEQVRDHQDSHWIYGAFDAPVSIDPVGALTAEPTLIPSDGAVTTPNPAPSDDATPSPRHARARRPLWLDIAGAVRDVVLSVFAFLAMMAGVLAYVDGVL